MKETTSSATQNGLRKDSDQTVNAQADLNLRLAHMSEGTFSDVSDYIVKKGVCRGLHFLPLGYKPFFVVNSKFHAQQGLKISSVKV